MTEVVISALPEGLSVPIPSTVVPSRNSTTPVALDGVTSAVKVTGWPNWEESGETESETDVDGGAVAISTATLNSPVVTTTSDLPSPLKSPTASPYRFL